MLKFMLVSMSVLALSGCMEPRCQQKPDQKLRAEIFKSCMASLPAGPVSTKYNDWAEVVDKCDDIAYYQSLRGCGL